MVLYTIISSPLELLADSGPFVPILIMILKEDPLLVGGPLLILDGRIELIVPSLSALLASPSKDFELDFHSSRNSTPLLDFFNLNDVQQGVVLLSSRDDTSLVQAFLSPIYLIKVGIIPKPIAPHTFSCTKSKYQRGCSFRFGEGERDSLENMYEI